MTVSGPFSQWWQSDGRQVESEVRGQSWPSPQDLPAHQAWADGWAGDPGNRLGVVSCRAPEPLPKLPTGWTQALRQQWNIPPLGLWDLITEAVHLGHSLRDLPRCLAGLRSLRSSWVLGRGSFSDDGWAVSGDLTFQELPIEICLLLARTGHPEGESYTWEPCPFLSEQNSICLGEIYRNIITWPWPDLKNKGSDTLLTTNHVPPPFLGKGFAESCQEFAVFKAWSTHLLAWPSINLYQFQTPTFWNCLASLCAGHLDLCFGNTVSANKLRRCSQRSLRCESQLGSLRSVPRAVKLKATLGSLSPPGRTAAQAGRLPTTGSAVPSSLREGGCDWRVAAPLTLPA